MSQYTILYVIIIHIRAIIVLLRQTSEASAFLLSLWCVWSCHPLTENQHGTSTVVVAIAVTQSCVSLRLPMYMYV